MKMLLTSLMIASCINTTAQSLSTNNADISVNDLPENVIITSENTKLLGGINIIIDYKNSVAKTKLSELNSILQNGKDLKVRNQTDLLNSMSKLGFEYVNAYIGRDSGYEGKIYEASKYWVNMVFRKKLKYRTE